MSTLETLVNELPPDLQQEVYDFARNLMEMRVKKVRKPPTFNWAGGLQDLAEYTSVELQHKASEWRGAHM